jgi:Protein of unknown function (DUF3102)
MTSMARFNSERPAPTQTPAPAIYVIRPGIEDLANSVADRFHRWQRATVAEAIEIGTDLIKVKEALGHGSFGHWLEKQFGEKRTAQRLMQIAVKFASKNDTVSHLSLSTVYLLASPSTPEPLTNRVLAQIEAGEEITEPALKVEIKHAKLIARKQQRRSLAAKRWREQRKAGVSPDEKWRRQEEE